MLFMCLLLTVSVFSGGCWHLMEPHHFVHEECFMEDFGVECLCLMMHISVSWIMPVFDGDF